jgi:predicted metal-binding membrane protein
MSTVATETRARRASTVFFLFSVAAACWAVTVERMQGMNMGPRTDLGSLGWFAVVWVTMMAAMMLPSLSPMAVVSARSIGRTVVYTAGYLLPWIAFGLLAYALVEGVRSLDVGLLAWDGTGRYVAALVLLGAALYELTAAKRSCLRRCRDSQLVRRRRGACGALLMGIEQGGFCVGCSGAVMATLFALGVMNIAWMLVIAVLIALEKLLPWTAITIGAAAAALALTGLSMIV